MITASIPIEMTGSWLYPDSFAQTYVSTEVEINPADYPGMTNAWFECLIEGVTGTGEDATGYGTVYLVDGSDTVYATCTHTDRYLERIRQSVVLKEGATKYYVKMMASPGGADFDIRTARIIIDVEDSDSIKVPLEMAVGDQSSGGETGSSADNDFYAYAYASMSATYENVTFGDYYYRLLYIDKSKWDTVTEWRFEVIAADQGGTGYVALFNSTTGIMIPGSELSFSSYTPTRKSVVISDANMPNGTNIEVRLKTDGGYTALHCARLWVTLNPATSAEVHWRVGSPTGGNTPTGGLTNPDNDNTYSTESRYLYEPSKFAANTPVYFESCAKETGSEGTEAHMFLCDAGTADSDLEAYTASASSYSVSGSHYDTVDTVGIVPGYVGYWFWPAEVADGYEGGGQIGFILDGSDSYIDYLVGTLTNVAAGYLAPGATSLTITGSGFNFTGKFPSGNPIRQVIVKAIAWGLRRYMAAGSTSALANIGLTGGTSHTYSFSIGALADAGSIAGSAVSAAGIVTSEASWDVAALNSSSVDVEVKIPDTNETFGNVAWIGLYASSAYDIPTSQLDFSKTTYERQRSADLSGDLVDGSRYLIHFYTTNNNYIAQHSAMWLVFDVQGEGGGGGGTASCLNVSATLDPDTMIVTGSGNGSYATEWRVVRTSDNVVMDSGVGAAASFTFTGEYGVEYQLQFR